MLVLARALEKALSSAAMELDGLVAALLLALVTCAASGKSCLFPCPRRLDDAGEQAARDLALLFAPAPGLSCTDAIVFSWGTGSVDVPPECDPIQTMVSVCNALLLVFSLPLS